MTLAERAATRILTTQAHAGALDHERSKRDSFSKRPIDRRTAVAHLRAARQLAHHLRIHMKSFRHYRDLVTDTLDRLGRDTRRHHFRTIKLLDARVRLPGLFRHLALRIRERV